MIHLVHPEILQIVDSLFMECYNDSKRREQSPIYAVYSFSFFWDDSSCWKQEKRRRGKKKVKAES